VKPSVTVLTRHHTTELRISEKGSTFRGSSEQIQEPQYGLIIHGFLRKEIMEKPEATKLVDSIVSTYGKSDSLQIGDRASIRQSKKEDLDYTTLVGIPDFRKHPMLLPSSILEVNMIARDEAECHQYTQRILDAARLYNVGSVYPIQSHSWKRSAIWPGAESISTGLPVFSPKQARVCHGKRSRLTFIVWE